MRGAYFTGISHKDYKALDAELRVVRLALDALGVQALDSLAALEALVKVKGRLTASAGAA